MVLEALVCGSTKSFGVVANERPELGRMIVFFREPKPVIVTSTSSPGLRKTGGFCPNPTPAGYIVFVSKKLEKKSI